MKRARLNLVLLVLVAALGVGVWFSQEEEEVGPPLTPYAEAAVEKIVIAHPDRDPIELAKKEGAWRIVAPVQAAVDALEVNALLELATREAKQSLEIGSTKLAQMDLDPPKYSITLNDTKVEFGGTEPLNYRRYVKVGNKVSLIEDPPSAALDADYHDLVAKKLFADGEAIERIEVPGLALAKNEDGVLQLSPPDDDATTDQMQKMIDGWKSATAMWNEMPDEKPEGESVKITLKGGELREYVLVDREPQFRLYSPKAGVVHVLSKALTKTLLQLPPPPEPEEGDEEDAEDAEDGQDAAPVETES